MAVLTMGNNLVENLVFVMFLMGELNFYQLLQ